LGRVPDEHAAAVAPPAADACAPPPAAPAALLKLWLGGSRGNLVLLVGPCDAGKTTLFHQLTSGSTHQGTVASMQSNLAEGALASEKVGGWPMGGVVGGVVVGR
jgi:energy-coupling factor transporter ATP-binding protein EcfA2